MFEKYPVNYALILSGVHAITLFTVFFSLPQRTHCRPNSSKREINLF